MVASDSFLPGFLRSRPNLVNRMDYNHTFTGDFYVSALRSWKTVLMILVMWISEEPFALPAQSFWDGVVALDLGQYRVHTIEWSRHMRDWVLSSLSKLRSGYSMPLREI